MNQRKEATRRGPFMIAAAAVVVVVALVVYWFVIRDDSDTKDKVSAPPKTLPARTFLAPGNSFSFKYPGNFVQTAGSAGYVWVAGVGTYDILSVKRIANEPTAPSKLISTIPPTLLAVPGTKIKNQGTDQRAGVPMVTFTIDTTNSGQPVSAKLYFFTANGVTWQFACESQTRAAVINAACSAALQSFQLP